MRQFGFRDASRARDRCLHPRPQNYPQFPSLRAPPWRFVAPRDRGALGAPASQFQNFLKPVRVPGGGRGAKSGYIAPWPVVLDTEWTHHQDQGAVEAPGSNHTCVDRTLHPVRLMREALSAFEPFEDTWTRCNIIPMLFLEAKAPTQPEPKPPLHHAAQAFAEQRLRERKLQHTHGRGAGPRDRERRDRGPEARNPEARSPQAEAEAAEAPGAGGPGPGPQDPRVPGA